jgi:hypothetical protein
MHCLKFAFAVGVVLVATAPGFAQAPPPLTEARKVLTEAANALGMVRGVERSLTIVNMFAFTASGTLAKGAGNPEPVTRFTADYDYVIPAARVDVEWPDARRTIEVAAGAQAWDETTPGIFSGRAAGSAAERLKLLWLMPHGIILAGAAAPDKVTIADKGGLKELVVPLPNGGEGRGLLDAKNFITRVEVRIGTQVLTGEYAEYKDFQDYGVMFPVRIVQEIDGRPFADLTVTDQLANPYMVFPVPKEL